MKVIRIIIEIDDDNDDDRNDATIDNLAMAYDKGYDAGVENASKAQPPAGDTNWNSGAGGSFVAPAGRGGVGAPTQRFKASKANDGTGYAQAYNPDV
jgi:hypothetical protein